MLGECGMLELDRRALRKRSVTLCKEMVVDELLIQSLQADDILTDSMAESILAEPTSHKRGWRLLSLLPKRGPRAFSSFCSALRDTEQQHLCALLTESPERDSRERDRERQRYVDSPLPLPTQEGKVAAKRARTQVSMEMCLDADSPITTPVLPCTQDFYRSRCLQSYSMVSSPRGQALVISNVSFDPCAAPDLDSRRGGEVDEEVLRKVFTELDYIVTVRRDLTAQGMRACIEQFGRRQEHQTLSSCVVCLLSHGVEGAIYGTDGQLLELDWVFEAFDNAHCPLLQNKPKMFFIQACRGEEMDCGVEQSDGPERTQSPGCEQRDAGREGEGDGDTRQTEERGRLRVKLPQRSDMICGFASLKGTAAMRNTKRGSWFIQELNSALRFRARDTHLSDILVQVNGRIKEREGYAPGTPHHRCKEMSEFTSSLCKDLYLFPKYHPQY
ncbi:caspase-2 [Coregonus clupeaformis]|nr:caspase-2 [Coregonus clupeaformis]XP_041758688.1 caspase-2 [Coregonus clupeaformis]XP_041758689.1 caspase-2 [Coregonus clupeaformis]XP_041758690.1 caspase-2 [Coregonus clupeaformis]XP_041758691.1 caspase-2 [Coregonus clupeaformis]XP_045069694.1 caspase-2 [Coregonus clupeaformis]